MLSNEMEQIKYSNDWSHLWNIEVVVFSEPKTVVLPVETQLIPRPTLIVKAD